MKKRILIHSHDEENQATRFTIWPEYEGLRRSAYELTEEIEDDFFGVTTLEWGKIIVEAIEKWAELHDLKTIMFDYKHPGFWRRLLKPNSKPFYKQLVENYFDIEFVNMCQEWYHGELTFLLATRESASLIPSKQ
jgi:hypothetical protein